MKLLACCACLLLTCALTAQADLSYDALDRAKSFPNPAVNTVSWANAGVFDIPADLSAFPLNGPVRETTHIQIKDNKLSTTTQNIRRIYDLSEGTLVILDLQTHFYSIETLDRAYARLVKQYRSWQSYGTDRDFQVSARKTGRTLRLNDQATAEYELVAITTVRGRPRVAESEILWIAEQSPASQLDEFRKNWTGKTKLPFPNGIDELNDFGMAEARKSISGYLLGFVTESRPYMLTEANSKRPNTGYEASRAELPSQSQDLLRSYEPLIYKVRIRQTTLANFSTGAVPNDAFAIPTGFKQKKSLIALP